MASTMHSSTYAQVSSWHQSAAAALAAPLRPLASLIPKPAAAGLGGGGLAVGTGWDNEGEFAVQSGLPISTDRVRPNSSLKLN